MADMRTRLAVVILTVVAVSAASVIALSYSPQVTHVVGWLDPWSIQDVYDNSLYVVRGTVAELSIIMDKESEAFGNKPIVFTDVGIAIEEELAGKYPHDEITIRTVGGKADLHWTNSTIHPRFEMGENVVLFVGYESDSEMGDNYFVAGHRLGKYHLEGGKYFGDEYEDGLDEKRFISIIRQMASQ